MKYLEKIKPSEWYRAISWLLEDKLQQAADMKWEKEPANRSTKGQRGLFTVRSLSHPRQGKRNLVLRTF